MRSKFISGFALLILFALPCTVHSQTASTDQTLQPSRKGLVPLHWPDLAKLEADVREQISLAQNSLAATVKDSAISETALGEAYGKLGQIYHAYSLTSPARECYVNATLLAPKDFRWVYLLGRLDQQEARFDDAIRRYEVARTLKPDYVAVLVNLGNIFLELNRLDEAKKAFNEGLALEGNNPAAHYGLGQVALSQRNYSDAIDHFEKTLTQVPAANRVHYSLAMAYRGLGDTERVRAHLAQQGSVGVRVSDPVFDGLQELIEGERVHLSRGKVAFEARRYEEAAAEFRKAVSAKPDSVTARVNLGAALTKMGDMKGATDQFQEAVRLDPSRANAQYNLAILFSAQNKHDEAIAHLRLALSSDAQDLDARYLLAQELSKSGHPDEALIEFSKVVQAKPDLEGAVVEQVKLFHRKGQYRQALETIETSHARYPQKGRTTVLLSYLLATTPSLELRNGTRALELAQRVYSATAAFQHGALVAIALAELGRCREAADWQRRMIADAEQKRSAELLHKLQTNLKLYEGVQTCRPAGDTSLNDLPFFEKER